MSAGSLGVHIDRFRDRAVESARQADAARELAADIRRRRTALVTRIERSLFAHTAAVWSSCAADQSRDVLRNEIGFGIWSAAMSLSETSDALESSAVDLDDDARGYRRQAEVLESETVVTDPLDPVA